MHPLTFKLKRMHYSLLALQRRLLLQLDITPARVELLIIMAWMGNGPQKAMVQSDIWRALGVRRSVTCRMLAALEEDGFITRSRHFSDMRQKNVYLTAKARLLLFRVEQLAFRLKFVLMVAFAPKKELFKELGAGLDWARRQFDRSWLTFPWFVRPARWLRPMPL